MTAREIIDIYISFFEKRGHKQIANSPLVPENDSTTLFTSSGMQPLINYLLGEKHPQGTKLVNVQNSFRGQDIEEVGDNRHTTFFRMLGNWSLGDYFKTDEIPWLWEFLTKELGLPKDKLYITVFDGDKNFKLLKNDKYQPLTPDVESKDIWTKVFQDEKINPEGKIFFSGAEHNWWSRSGTPEKMPIGEIGGPDTEVYFDFSPDQEKITQENFVKHADSGRLLEIANSVFMQYKKIGDKTFEELPKKNVDFGGGLERILAAVENKSDIFQTSLFKPLVEKIYLELGTDYDKEKKNIQVIADHIKSAVFLIKDGVIPDNKLQGYVLRRLLRRVATKAFLINKEKSDSKFFGALIKAVIDSESESFEKNEIMRIEEEVSREIRKFRATLEKGLQRLNKSIENKEKLGLAVFNLFQSYGYPLELTIELLNDRGIKFTDSDLSQYEEAKKFHAEQSKVASVGMFKGGLADTSAQTVMGHTATHLLHQALRDVLGDKVHQSGSNITSERVRFDFNLNRSLTPDELKQVEDIVNGKIKENLEVHFEIMPLNKAKEIGAIGLFDDKYEKDVKVYFIGDYSKEFCGGPHVDFTGKLKTFRIIKQDNLGRGMRRLYAKVG